MSNPSNISNTRRIFIFSASTTCSYFSTRYHLIGNETGKNNMQRIIFKKPNHIQMTVLKKNSFEFRGELLFSSNLSFLSYAYSQYSCDSELNNTDKFCPEIILAFHRWYIDGKERRREGSSFTYCFHVMISLG